MRYWTTDRIIKKISKPYPLVFPTTFDLIPLMSFQQAQDPDLSLRQFIGSVSISLGSKRDEFKSKEHDIQYSVNVNNPKKTDVKFDGNIKQKTLWNQVLDDLGAEITELNVSLRVSAINASFTPDLGIESFWLLQRKTGNFTRSLKRRFGLHGIRNVYYPIKNELTTRRLWKPEYRHKLRGILKTTNLVGNDGSKLVPWQEFLSIPKNHRFPPTINELNDNLTTGKWWNDCGVPVRLLGAVDSFDVEAVLYMLRRRKILITA